MMAIKSKHKYPGVRKKSAGKFILDFIDHNGKRRQKLFHGSELEAYRSRNAIISRRDKIRAGIEAPPSIVKDKPTFNKVWELFTKHRQQKVDTGSMKAGSLKRYKWVCKAIAGYSKKLLNTPIDKISPDDIINFKKHRLSLKVSDEGINTEIRHIRTVFNYAKKLELITTSPMVDVSNIQVVKSDVRFLDDHELVRLNVELNKLNLNDAYEKDVHDLVVFYLYTGARSSEALYPDLTWDCINAKTIVFPRTKNNKSRTVSLFKPVKNVLDSRVNLPGGPFDFTTNQVYNRIKFVLKKANLNNASPHNLRKTAGAWYYMATRDIFAVKCWLGHSNVTVTENHYTGLIQSMRETDDKAFEELLTAKLESAT
jgi:integrase